MKLTRSALLFGAGLLGVASETIYSLRFHQTPDPTLLIIFAAMMGLPVYLSQDSKGSHGSLRGSDDTEASPPSAPKARARKQPAESSED